MGSYHCSCPVGFFYDAEKRICAGMLSIVGLLHEILYIKGAVRNIMGATQWAPPNGHHPKDGSFAPGTTMPIFVIICNWHRSRYLKVAIFAGTNV